MLTKYFESGYVPILVAKNGKNPIHNDWSKWCYEKPSEDLISKWDEQFLNNALNVGIACGPASGIVVLDVDTDDVEFLKICPLSPVSRRGKKGEARFFRYNKNIVSRSFPSLDIIAAGRQILVPPSIHPDTLKPYVWITPETLFDFKPEELPELDLSFLSKLNQKFQDVGPKATGRNNKLVEMVTAMRFRAEPEAKIVNEIYDWDFRYHQPRLFTDKNEGFSARDEDEAKNNAWDFVSNVTKSLRKAGKIKLEENNISIELTEEDEKRILEKYSHMSYPEPTGLLKDIRDLILDYSERDMPNLALGGAVSLMSAVCSNKFRFDQCWPNTFVLNLAPTGAGKSFPQRIISMILDEKLSSQLVGYGNYQSSSAFTKNLLARRERLDMIDEISSLFAQMKSGGPWQMAILEEMCKVWSSSSGKFNASEYAEKQNNSSCFNPCVNVLGSSTIEGIKSNITKMMVTKGLIPRFLIFSHDNYGKLKKDFLNEDLLKVVCSHIKQILNTPKVTQDITGGLSPVDPPNMAPIDEDSVRLFEVIKLKYALRVEKEESGAMQELLTRGKEQIMKLALIHAVGNSRRVDTRDLAWAEKTFEVCMHNSSAFIKESAVDNDWERDCVAVLNTIKKKGHITFAVLSSRFPRIPNIRLKSLIDHLIVNESIQSVIKETKQKKIPGYSIRD